MSATYSPAWRHGSAWWVTERGSDGGVVDIRVTGPDDDSAGARVLYDPDCSLCYLGYAHSLQYHVARLLETATIRQAQRIYLA